MTDAGSSPHPFFFFLVPLSVAGLTALGIWIALTFPNFLAMALTVLFVALLAWSGTRVVQAPPPS